MSTKTGIQWTSATWNPIRGCSKVSAGCANCYAESTAARFSGDGQPYEGLVDNKRWNGTVRVVQKHLDDPLRWSKPRRVFVNSMSDLFHESLSNEDISAVFNTIRQCQAEGREHVFQILTKRPERMRHVMRRLRFDGTGAGKVWVAENEDDSGYPLGAEHRGATGLTNIHLGVSAEDQKTADERIPILLDTPAAVRWISAEPLLGPVDLGGHRENGALRDYLIPSPILDMTRNPWESLSYRDGLDWVVVGGESGPNARPCDVGWIRSIVEQCRTADVPVFVKQLGARPFDSQRGVEVVPGEARALARSGYLSCNGFALAIRHRKGGDPDEWPEDLRVREFPEVGS